MYAINVKLRSCNSLNISMMFNRKILKKHFLSKYICTLLIFILRYEKSISDDGAKGLKLETKV